ncbi:MAG: hypothetical protein M3Q45_14495, partial [Chloroflexota bacterium]|nr:hypothetical protein [Chloroflexota bacterium]
ALNHAALLIAQPLPASAALFAAVEDALALQYLIDIWQIRPDLVVVSSSQAAILLKQGQRVFATWQAATTLRAELPPTLVTTQQSASPDWIQFHNREGEATDTPDQAPQVRVDHVMTPDIALLGYSVVPTPATQPVTALNPTGMDVTLFWRLRNDWPAGLSISVRPTANGGFIPNPAGGIIQQDSSSPAHGLLANAASLSPVADAYRLGLPAALPVGADGFAVILYRSGANGFENVAEINLPIP